MKKQKILIVGGGFGGVRAARELADDKRFDITLISDVPYMQYYPSLYHTATGGLTAQSKIPLQDIFANTEVQIVTDRATKLDRRAKVLTTASGEIYEYDTIVLGLGVVTNYFGIPGLAEHTYSIKSIDEIERFKTHIHEQLIETDAPDVHYIIVGAGPTGIELAGALPQYLHKIMERHCIANRKVKVDLIEGANRCLPRMSKHISRKTARRLKALGVTIHTGACVEGASADGLAVSGKKLPSKTIVWTAGVTNNAFFANNGFSFGPHGKVAVNVYLQADDNVYVIGDNANTPYSGMAQTALYDGNFVAKNIIRSIDDKDLKPYKPKKPIYVTPVGYGWAIVQWGSITISGIFGYLLHYAAYASGFAQIKGIIPGAKQWFTEFGEDETCVVCKHAISHK
jgi:NADH:ubiquinone reductase (H+-translocating)